MKWVEEDSNYSPHDWYYVDPAGKVVAAVVTRKNAAYIYVYEGSHPRMDCTYIDQESAKKAVEQRFAR